jgi:hypothetical protein
MAHKVLINDSRDGMEGWQWLQVVTVKDIPEPAITMNKCKKQLMLIKIWFRFASVFLIGNGTAFFAKTGFVL